MKTKSNNRLRIGGNIKVISGKYKNKIGFISQIFSNKNQVIVKNLNNKIINKKPSLKGALGEKQKNEFPIHCSNIKAIKN